MKSFFKTSLVLALFAAMSAHAAEVELVFDPEDDITPPSVLYQFDTLNVDATGKITVSGAQYISGFFPGSDGSLTCDPETTEEREGVCVGIGGGASSSVSSSSSSAASSSVGSSSSAPAGCEGVAGVAVETYGNEVTLGVPSGRRTLELSRTGLHVIPFRTGSSSLFRGKFTLAGTVGQGDVTREMWISSCPGAAPVANVCSKVGATEQVINLSQGNVFLWCNLQTNRDYYLNIRNSGTSCNKSVGCDAYIDHSPQNPI